MTATQVDEESPLLRSQQAKVKRTPLPWFQLCIVLVLQLAEPLTSQVIYPFTPQVRRLRILSPYISYPYQLMRDIGITHGDETKVGYYVGLMVRLPTRLPHNAHPLSAISVFLDASRHRSTLVPFVGSHWTQACYSIRTVWTVAFHVLFWSIYHLPWPCHESSSQRRPE